MSTEPSTQSNQPLGTSGDIRRRVLLHHVPLAVGSAVVLALFMGLPIFARAAGHHGPGAAMSHRGTGAAMGHHGIDTATEGQQGQQAPMSHLMSHGHGGARGRGAAQTGRTAPRGESGQARQAGATAHHNSAAPTADHDSNQAAAPQDGGFSTTGGMHQFVTATGYLGLGFLARTLLVGSANLLLRRRTPVSNYLARDVGTWAAMFSVIHTVAIVATAARVDGSVIAGSLHFFVAPDGSLLTNSFGLGNWTGLAALVIVVGLLAISSDAALRTFKAGPWKRFQRLNYALFGLVVLHAFFYGALLRITSPFTLLLLVSVATVVVGQMVGMWLWKRRYMGSAARVA